MKAYVAPPCSRLDEPPMVAVVEEGRGFAELEGEWDGLHAASPAATPFQSWAWLYSWWEHYGQGRHRLRLVTVREGAGGPLVGVAPLMVEGRRGPGGLLLGGTGVLCYQDLRAREGWEGVVAGAAAGAVRRMGGWAVADLQELRPDADSWRLFEAWDGPKARAWQSSCPVVDVRPWDQMLKGLRQKQRYHARRAVKMAEEDGLRVERLRPGEAGEAARRLVALHRESWQGRDIGPEHLTGRFEAHLEAAVPRLMARGLATLSEFRRDEEPVISSFSLVGRGAVNWYLGGSTREALLRYRVSSLHIWEGVRIALERDVPCLDMLRGEESYKLKWSARVVPNHRVILGRGPSFLWAAYAGYHALSAWALRYAHANSASIPPWVKASFTRGRALCRWVVLRTRGDQRS